MKEAQGMRSSRMGNKPVVEEKTEEVKQQPVPDMQVEAETLEELEDEEKPDAGADEGEGKGQTPESLATLMQSLIKIGEGGSMVESRAILERIMPPTKLEATALSDKIRRMNMAMEQLRNLALELAFKRS